ncbi:hypothetical protein KAI46_02790, partial [bacterium]|nr:hypothetical protein [bacterium]
MISEKLSSYKTVVFFMTFLFTVGLFLWMVKPFIYTLALALIMVGLCHPIYLSLIKFCGDRSWLASGLICLAIFLGIFVPLVFLITSLSVEV